MITITKRTRSPEKKYTTQTVAFAVGISESAITSFFSKQNISTKGGITLDQVEAVLESKRRGQSVKWRDVEELRNRLRDRGWEITEEETDEEEGRLPL